MRENKTCPDHGWHQLPAEELDQILQAELEKDHPSQEVVLPILQILEEREKDFPVEKTPEVLAVLDKLKKHETPTKHPKNRRPWIAGIAAIAAVACIVVMAIPRTVGAESIFDVLFRWTEGIFEFFTPEQDVTNPPVDFVFETDNVGLQQLYDKVSELGVTDPVVPMWLPEGFVLSEMRVAPMPGGTKMHVQFDNGNAGILFTYHVSTKITSSLEKKETGVELFEFSDVSHFILDNEGALSVTWVVDGVECIINTSISKEDLYMIIKSIYRSEIL